MLRTVCARYWSGAWPLVAIALAQRCVAHLGRPGLGVSEEEALVAGQAVDHRRWLAASEALIGVVGRGEAGDVGDILAERQLAVDVQAGEGLIGVDTAGERLAGLAEVREVGRGPPVAQRARWNRTRRRDCRSCG